VHPQHRTRQYRFKMSGLRAAVPDTYQYCTISLQKSYITIESKSTVYSNTQPDTTQKFDDFVDLAASRDEHDLHCDKKLKQAFINNKLIFVSDGSVKNSIGAGLWICSSKDIFHFHSKGAISCPGNKHDIDSHRAECIGILGAISHFTQVIT
jgi:hypothetical protein